MERLTHTETPANHVYVDRELVQLCWYSEMEEGFRGPAIDRLAAYEDTGLTPDKLAHAAELLKAEKEGRCMVLPCKPSDVTVYQIRTKKHARGAGVSPRHISATTIWADGDYSLHHQGADDCLKKDLGKTWFLTRAEAEAALGGGGE